MLKYMSKAGTFTSLAKCCSSHKDRVGERREQEENIIGKEKKMKNYGDTTKIPILSHKASQILQQLAGNLSPTYLLDEVRNFSSLHFHEFIPLWLVSSF